MTTDTYWPQDKVYLYATSALFPEKISGRPIPTEELKRYIPYFWDHQEQGEALWELASDKLLTFTERKIDESSSEYVIDNINSDQFKTYLIEYLDRFRNDELISDPSEQPERFSVSREKLVDYLIHSSRDEPLVNPMNVWEGWNLFYASRYLFLETVLVTDLIYHQVKILDLGMLESIQDKGEVPVVRLALTDNFRPSDKKEDSTPTKAMLALEAVDSKNRRLLVKVNGADYVIKSSLRTDLAPHSLIQYLISNPGKNVTIDFARKRIDGCDAVSDLSEVLRQCGLSKELKEILFDRCTIKEVQLKTEPYVTEAQLAKFIN